MKESKLSYVTRLFQRTSDTVTNPADLKGLAANIEVLKKGNEALRSNWEGDRENVLSRFVDAAEDTASITSTAPSRRIAVRE